MVWKRMRRLCCSVSVGPLAMVLRMLWLTYICSDSPLNAEAAELWDKDIKEFTVKVKARHRDIDDD